MRTSLSQQEATQGTTVRASQPEATPSAQRPQPPGMTSVMLGLQRTRGNQYVQRVLQRKCGCGPGERDAEPLVQPKLSISEPGDVYEQEADAVAREIVEKQYSSHSNADEGRGEGETPVSVRRMIQRQETSNPPEMEEELKKAQNVQRKGEGEATAAPELDQRLASLAGGGSPLPPAVQQRMEGSFGVNFDRVRIHTDGEAAQLSRSIRAEAFTYGNDIYFGSNKFDPSSRSGTELLAHELTHTLQQSGVRRKSIQRRGGAAVGTLATTRSSTSGKTTGRTS